MVKRFFITILVIYISVSAINGQSVKSDKLFGKGIECFEKGDLAKAISYFEKASALDKKEIDPSSPRSGYSDGWIAHCYFLMGDTIKAKQFQKYNYDIKPIDRRLTVKSDKEAELAIKSSKNGQYQEAIQHVLKSIEMEKQIGGDTIPGSIMSYSLLGDNYRYAGDYHNAINSYDICYDKLSKLGFSDNNLIFNCIFGKACCYFELGYDTSLQIELNKLKEIAQKNISHYKDFIPAIVTDTFQARIEIQKNNFDLAAQFATDAIETAIDNYDPQNDEIIQNLLEGVITLRMTGQYDNINNLLDKALKVVEAQKDVNIFHRGSLLSYKGQYATDIDYAINTLKESMELLANSKYDDLYQSTKKLLAVYLSYNSSTIREAIQLYNEILEYYQEKDDTNPTYFDAKISLAKLFAELKDYDKSINLYQEVLNKLSFDKTDPVYILTFLGYLPLQLNYLLINNQWINENELDSQEDNFNNGFKLGEEFGKVFSNINLNRFLMVGYDITTITEAILPIFELIVSNPAISSVIPLQTVQNMIVQMHFHLLSFLPEENQYVTRTLSLMSHIDYLLGRTDEAIHYLEHLINTAKTHDLPYDNYIHDLAYYQYDSGDTYNAFDNFQEGFKYLKKLTLEAYKWMTTSERTTYTNATRGNIDIFPQFAAKTAADRRYAGLAYNTLLFSKGLLLNSSIELSKLIQEEGKTESLHLYNDWQTYRKKYQNAVARNMADASSLKNKADDLEKKLMESCRAYSDYTANLSIEYPEVQKALQDNDVAIEFFSYQRDATSRAYGALLLSKNEDPIYLPVGIDSDWTDYIDNCYQDQTLFMQMFEHLKPYLPNKESGNIYFAADAFLHTIAIENMAGAEEYNLIRLSSTRELADILPNGNITDITMFGGIKYGLGKLADFYKPEKSIGKDRDSDEFLRPLPGTAEEIENITNVLPSSINVTVYSDNNGNEERFKALSGKNTDIIHIATHGYFKHYHTHTTNEEAIENMMTSSGLYLAGAQNTLWEMKEKSMKEDGILNAQEIADLDLRNVKLAVLSACETGNGNIVSDGVFGLQRGFKQAGVKSLLMSLWKVDDEATQMLMTNFYINLKNSGNQYDALKKAQIEVKKYFPDPKYWAAFILIDALQPLQLAI